MAETITTASGHRFTDYTLEDLRQYARNLAKSKCFKTSGKRAKFKPGFILRVTNNGAQLIIQASSEDRTGEIERGTTL